MKTILVVDDATRFPGPLADVEITTSQAYLTDKDYQERGFRVINLCSNYRYQESGYYVSLLAQARDHKVFPDLESVLQMKARFLLKIASLDLDELLQKHLKSLDGTEYKLNIYFGKSANPAMQKIADELHKSYDVPLIGATFKLKDKWSLSKVSPLSISDVPKEHEGVLVESLNAYIGRRRIQKRKIKNPRFELAFLVDPQEKHPPSDAKALKEFKKAANRLEMNVEMITKDDFDRLLEFDGLFIRETTAVNHHTYRFAQMAQSRGLVVIDDPVSILKCTNKVYLAELFNQHKIPAPATVLIHRKNYKELQASLALPAILKSPDSSFSRGVIRVSSREELKRTLEDLLEHSTIVLAQEFLETSFDWRIGILEGKPLYACKYFMAKGHWQIYNHQATGRHLNGHAETFALDEAPSEALKIATKACKLIGNGFYGVDIKEAAGKFYVIEINDNPSIDGGIEDHIIKDNLYLKIMKCFLSRLEKRAQGDKL